MLPCSCSRRRRTPCWSGRTACWSGRTPCWALPGCGPDEQFTRFAYTLADNDQHRAVRPQFLAVALAGWDPKGKVDPKATADCSSIAELTAAQVALSLCVVRTLLFSLLL